MAADPRPDPGLELVEVIGDDGQVLRVVTRAEVRAGRLRHRCTFIVVRNAAGEVLIHRRSDDKDIWPGRWDLACGGVVTAGEEWESAARRELAEELGIEGVELIYLGEHSYADADVDEVARVRTTEWNGPVTFADGEVVEARLVDLDDLARRIGRDRFVSDSLEVVLPHLVP